MYTHFEDDEVAADYLVLLRRGSVLRRLALDQHAAWRQAIRAKARSDELTIRTWSRGGMPATVGATLPDWRLTADDREALQRRASWLRED